MRKLKLQMQISADGYAAGPNGELDWMTWDWDDKLKKFVGDLTESVDTIILGRKMTDNFVSAWTGISRNPDDENYTFAQKMIETPKYVFSKTLEKSVWENTELANDLSKVTDLKSQDGKDIIVYGGAGFVSNLIKNGLIDDLYLFYNPVAIGNGMPIFNGDKNVSMKLIESTPYECGVVVNHYQPA
jgi:dihydrofolate reductase